MTRKLRASSLATVSVLLLASSPVLSQDPRFHYGVSAPADVIGEALETVTYSATATLTSDLATPDGAEGWSVSITCDGGVITSATTAGTAGATTGNGGLRDPLDGFEKTELTSGAGNEGAVSAVVLTQAGPTTLPPVGTANLLRVEVEASVPQAIVSGGHLVCDPSSVTLSFRNGLRGSGQPVENKVAYRGLDFRPVLASTTTSICPRIEMPRFDLVFSAPASVLGTAGGTVQYVTTAQLVTSSNTGPDGAEAWSISLSSTGSHIIAATVAGTAGALNTAGGLRSPVDGFEKTQLTVGAGNEGVVSAVTLSAESPVTLPPLGSSNLLRFTVEASVPDPVLASGAYVCDPAESRVFYVDGRRGSGQPVMNRAVYHGLSLVPTLGSTVTTVCPRITVPLFYYQVATPESVTGPAGERFEFEAVCRLRSTGNTGSDGAEAWSLGVAADNGVIVDATVDGTAGDLVENGGFRDPLDGFEKTEITVGPGNEGAVSAVVLSQSSGVTLPPVSTLPVLRLTVETEAAAPGTGSEGQEICLPIETRIFYRNDLAGSGQPVDNKVSWRGVTVIPTLEEGTTDVCPPLVNPLLFHVDALTPAGVAGAPVDGSTPWTVDIPPGPATTPVTVGIVLDSDLPLLDVGARGWSMSIRTDLCFGIASATIEGTDAQALFDQPLVKTEIVDPAKNGGQEGVISAIVLSQVEQVALPSVGSSLVLKVTGDMDSSAVTGSGVSSPPCGVAVNPANSGGLIGSSSSFPVETVVTAGPGLGTSRAPDVRGAEITLRGAAGGVQKPSDMNQDGQFNLSDPIATLNHLFIGGTSAPPPCGDNTIDDAANKSLLDSNGDGSINLSDPIYDLNFLFVGGIKPVSCTENSCPCIVIQGCPNNPVGDCEP